MLEPTSFQASVIEKFVNAKTNGGIVGLGVGSGKTLTSVEIIRQRGAKRALIIAPNSTFDGWANHVEWQMGLTVKRCGKDAISYTRVSDHTNRQATEDMKISAKESQANLLACQSGGDGIYFAGREFFVTQCFQKNSEGKVVRVPAWDKKRPFDLVVFDESQPTASRGNRSQRAWEFLKSDFKIASSADWFGANIENMYQVTSDVFGKQYVLDEFGTFDQWVKDWMLTEFDPFSYRKYKVVGEQWPGAFASSLPLYVTAPPSVIPPEPSERVVTLSRAERVLYDKLEKDMAAEIETGKLMVAENPLTLRIRLRELSLGVFRMVEDGDKQTIEFDPGEKSTKLEEAKSIMADYPNEKFVIFTHSAKFARKAAADLKRAEAWTGEQSDDDRKGIKQRFIEGDTRIIVATPNAAGVGIDGLQRVCRNVTFLSYSDSEQMNAQAVGRIARTGQSEQVQVWRITARDTYDSGQFSKLMETALKNSGAKAFSGLTS